MRSVRKFNESWVFTEGFDISKTGTLQTGESVVLPHNAVELPFSYCDESSYQKCFTYQRELDWEDGFAGREVVLRFEGAMANSAVYVYGKQACSHVDGYTPFEVVLTKHLNRGQNIITVKIDGSENPAIPPFGGRIDYLTYAGIYREVSLQVRSPISIMNSKIETPDVLERTKRVLVKCKLSGHGSSEIDGTVEATLRDQSGNLVADKIVPVASNEISIEIDGLSNIELWDTDNPNLYELTLDLKTERSDDQTKTIFGFRNAEFGVDGFKLNGKPLKLMGLNRHQAFPYSGYAQGRASQERDAEIMKYELSCNVVRTSHYPQCPHFLNHCDRIGLLVLTEIPGWQHIGDKAWQEESVRNVRRLVERDWNHPSIITWGVRINESEDNHDFYTATNAMARQLDATRQTSGIRKHPDSEFLEDIYTMNDFVQGMEEVSHNGASRVFLKPQKEQTGLNELVPYMVTEFNGHMYPTKVNDQEQRQAEHVTRHMNVLDRMFGDPNIAGCIGWCMCDYNTHKDFGSGDRICHHGVMSMHREPKFAAYAYASQGNPQNNPVLQPVTYYARGERNIGGILPLIILTNADEVELRFAGGKKQTFIPATDRYPNLPHAPVIIERDEVAADAFGKWGTDWLDLEIAGFLDGEEIMVKKLAAAPLPTTLEVVADRAEISSVDRDEVRVIARALDQFGNKLPFLSDQISINMSGPAELIGPSQSPIVGGSTGFWVKATGENGLISISVSSNSFETQYIKILAASEDLGYSGASQSE